MKIFTKEDYGKMMDLELSNFLRENTDGFDRSKVSLETNISFETLTKVSNRKRNLTEGNSIGIVKLILIAKENHSKRMERAEQLIINKS